MEGYGSDSDNSSEKKSKERFPRKKWLNIPFKLDRRKTCWAMYYMFRCYSIFLCIILSWTHLSSLFDVFIGSPSRLNTRLIYRAFSLWPPKPSPLPLLPLFFVVPELFHVKITCEHKNWNVRRFSLYFVKPVLASGRSWHWIKLGVPCFRFPGAWARDLEDISDAYVWHVNLYMLRIVVQLYICVLRILSVFLLML